MTRTVPQLLADAAAAHTDRTWLLHEDESLSFAATMRGVDAVASSLAQLGVAQGDIVMLIAHNSAAHVLAWLGALRLGAIALPVNPKSTAAELAGFLEQASPAVVIRDANRDLALEEARTRAGQRARVADVHTLAEGRASDVPTVAIDPMDPAVLIPTSGTTGRSKLVMQTHQAYVLAAEGFPWWLGLTSDDRLMTALPIFHINAPAYSLLGSLAVGASAVLLPRFSASNFLDEARRYGATEFNMIGAMIEMLMRQPEHADDADNPLRLCYTGPAPPRERHLEIERRFGIELTSGYALSETTYGTVWPRGERPYGTLGVARQHPTLGHVNDARVMADGREAETGGEGELELRNPAVMLGYYEMPDETERVLVDGWLRTGDLVRRNDDETFTFIARKKEVIRRRGENLAPAEVEEALVAFPGIVEAAVIAVPAELGEDDVKAFIVAAPGTDIDVRGVHASLFERLARFKVPRYFEVVDDLPRTPTGRVAKHRLATERSPRETDFEPVRGAEEVAR